MTYKNIFIFRSSCIILFILLHLISFSQVKKNNKVEDRIYLSPENDYLSDTSTSSKVKGKNADNLYNQLITSKSKVVRNVANVILIGGDPSFRDDKRDEELVLSTNYFKDFENLTIDSIIIDSHNIFYKGDSLSTNSWLERTIDKIHIKTKEKVISKYLLFKVGEKVNSLKIATTEYTLRNLPFIASAYITIKNDDIGGVILTVFTMDNWTISVTGELGDYPSLSLYDKNFLGSGNRLTVSYLHNGKCQKIGGKVEYLAKNIGGKFIDADVQLGVGQKNNVAYGYINREYMYPGDYFWDVEGGYVEKGEGQLTIDTTYYTAKLYFNSSFGKSFKISKKDESLFMYAGVGVDAKRYTDAPYNNPYYNPYYHDYSFFGYKVGIAKQNFFQGNMIYGYGVIEDIPYGFKFEMISGYGYSETNGSYTYFGGQARYGFYKDRFGFLDLNLRGSMKHLIDLNNWKFGSIDFNAKYFSPLKNLGLGYYLRFFVSLSHTQGFCRLYGERERLLFNSSYARIRGISTPIDRLGTVRSLINLESVFFTPFYFLHFRFAGFIWGDLGWLGDNSLFWKNYFCGSTGIGVRIKNERLVINNVEIRLGLALNKFPERGFSTFGISNESRYKIDSYAPMQIGEYEYK